MPTNRVRSFQVNAIQFGAAQIGRADIAIANIMTLAGQLAMDVYAAFLARVREWSVSLSGSISNGSSLFTAATTLGGSTDVPITPLAPPPLSGDETQFNQGMEYYAVRESPRSNATGTTSSTAITMTTPAPGMPTTLNQTAVTKVEGPTMGTMTTATVLGITQGRSQFDFGFLISDTAQNGVDMVFYTVHFRLQTSPIGHPIDAGGLSTPVLVGSLTVNIPDWISPDGITNSLELPLYCDSIGGEESWLVLSTGTAFSNAGGQTGSVTITMEPSGNADACWHYEDSNGVAAWDDDCNLLIPLPALAIQQP